MQKTCVIAKNVDEISRFIHNRCRWPLASTAGYDAMDFKIFEMRKTCWEMVNKQRGKEKETGAAREREAHL